jgi:hypothetical protein
MNKSFAAILKVQEIDFGEELELKGHANIDLVIEIVHSMQTKNSRWILNIERPRWELSD